jgi:hypothetical protein
MATDLEFRWNQWNIEKLEARNISPGEAEYIVRNAKPPYPRRHRKGSFFVHGKLPEGAALQVIYVIDEDGTLYVIHAFPTRKPRP